VTVCNTTVIGLIVKNSERDSAEEFFQLFKTPWEWCVSDHSYEVVISTTGELPRTINASACLIYDSSLTCFDRETGISIQSQRSGGWLKFECTDLPVYGNLCTFEDIGQAILRVRDEDRFAGCEVHSADRRIVRIGYDLFKEIAFLLSCGQPSTNAHIPALELHISLLRRILVGMGIAFVEVPPVPAGYDFMACLTHDVDFTGIREHKFDHTMWGFVYRAVVGSALEALKGRTEWSKWRTNLQAVLALPLVYAGLRDDFWLEFDRYRQIEKGLGSTFFLIPFRNHAGMLDSHPAPRRRATKYDLLKIKEEVFDLCNQGCEIGLHGIDAWQDPDQGRAERNRISAITQQSALGVRIHWLYFSNHSPKALENAGFLYDSTFGYNEAIGFRAGTAQVFRMAGASNLLELPLNIQDTALFYPDRMNLCEAEAMEACRQLMHHMAKVGGVLTVNWHTRSLSPERLWGTFYQALLAEMRKYRVWFGTGKQILSWFRARRALRFEQVQFAKDAWRMKVTGPALNGQPPFAIRVHPPRSCSSISSDASQKSAYSEISWEGKAELTLT
jgi:hypothetical protein